MPIKILFIVVITIFLGTNSYASPLHQSGPPLVKHDMQISLDPDQHEIEVVTTITLPATAILPLTFSLNSALQLERTTDVVPAAVNTTTGVQQYRVNKISNERQLRLRYKGKINIPLQQSKGDLRESLETQGIISDQGVYLDSSTLWFPRFDNEQVTFSLQIVTPPKWTVLSQGERLRVSTDNNKSFSTWSETNPQEDIYLIAGRFHEQNKKKYDLTLQTLLRSKDENLAEQYIDAAANYINAYQQALGPYPYKKFALVENFWETGFGMPSFTLLGPSVIRLPFILFSSYPHEILHNWWGNGVYIDASQGNWSEGLTSYLADHLIQEEKGEGAQYRLDALQKYRDFVSQENDFPLTSFRMRNSQATEAVGYGKVMMFFHALRLQLGDQQFLDGLKLFYRRNLFRRASFNDIQKSFEEATRKDLTTDFQQALTRTGAPQLRLSNASAKAAGGGYLLEFQLQQTQSEAPFRMYVPVAITMRDSPNVYQTIIPFFDKQLTVKIPLEKIPLRIDVDAEFDVFRLLDSQELPAALSQLFGAEHATIVLPSKASKPLFDAYQTLARTWAQSYAGEVQIVTDDKINMIPSHRAVWLLGWENRYLNDFAQFIRADGATIAPNSGVQIAERAYTREHNSFVLTSRDTVQNQTIGWIATSQVNAVPGLARKVPHYSKYGYLIFEGGEPTNISKGSWMAQNSTLTTFVSHEQGTTIEVARGKLAARQPLFPLLQSNERQGTTK